MTPFRVGIRNSASNKKKTNKQMKTTYILPRNQNQLGWVSLGLLERLLFLLSFMGASPPGLVMFCTQLIPHTVRYHCYIQGTGVSLGGGEEADKYKW